MLMKEEKNINQTNTRTQTNSQICSPTIFWLVDLSKTCATSATNGKL